MRQNKQEMDNVRSGYSKTNQSSTFLSNQDTHIKSPSFFNRESFYESESFDNALVRENKLKELKDKEQEEIQLAAIKEEEKAKRAASKEEKKARLTAIRIEKEKILDVTKEEKRISKEKEKAEHVAEKKDKAEKKLALKEEKKLALEEEKRAEALKAKMQQQVKNEETPVDIPHEEHKLDKKELGLIRQEQQAANKVARQEEKKQRELLKQQKYEDRITERYGEYYLHDLKNKEIAKQMAERRKFNKKDAERALRQYVIEAKKAIRQQERIDYLAQKEFEEKSHKQFIKSQRLARLAFEKEKKIQMHREIEALLLKAAERAQTKQEEIERKQRELALKLKNKELQAQLKIEAEQLIKSQQMAYQQELEKAKRDAMRVSMLNDINSKRMRELNLENESYLAKKESLILNARYKPLRDALARKEEVEALLRQARIIAKEESLKQKELDYYETNIRKEKENQEAFRLKEKELQQMLRQNALDRKIEEIERQKKRARHEAEVLEKIHLKELAEIAKLRKKELAYQQALYNKRVKEKERLIKIELAQKAQFYKELEKKELAKQRFDAKNNEIENKALIKAIAELNEQMMVEQEQIEDVSFAHENELALKAQEVDTKKAAIIARERELEAVKRLKLNLRNEEKRAAELKKIKEDNLKANKKAKLKARATAEKLELEQIKRLQEEIRLKEKAASARAKVIKDLNKARSSENKRAIQQAEKAAIEQLHTEEKLQLELQEQEDVRQAALLRAQREREYALEMELAIAKEKMLLELEKKSKTKAQIHDNKKHIKSYKKKAK